jgi:hypothetical protein
MLNVIFAMFATNICSFLNKSLLINLFWRSNSLQKTIKSGLYNYSRNLPSEFLLPSGDIRPPTLRNTTFSAAAGGSFYGQLPDKFAGYMIPSSRKSNPSPLNWKGFPQRLKLLYLSKRKVSFLVKIA